ncbi:hypothetical protein NEPAR04_0295 [Nematocida parisii]|nr:hypothetical protein NEPAR08_0289 [Nematocida parisii]KAI5126218.1 hypothetical protein NEPAR03_0390 [Nematocida parisii]KAI5140463.1 hypothetical protein NEPAR04_0295 [Nematocida parisii]
MDKLMKSLNSVIESAKEAGFNAHINENNASETTEDSLAQPEVKLEVVQETNQLQPQSNMAHWGIDMFQENMVKNMFCMFMASISSNILKIFDNIFNSIESQFGSSISSTIRYYIYVFLLISIFLFSYSIAILSILPIAYRLFYSLGELKPNDWMWPLAILGFVNVIVYLFVTSVFYFALALYIGVFFNSYFSNAQKLSIISLRTLELCILGVICSTNLLVLYYKTKIFYLLGGTYMGLACNFIIWFTFIYSNIIILRFIYTKMRKWIKLKTNQQTEDQKSEELEKPKYTLDMLNIMLIVLLSLILSFITCKWMVIMSSIGAVTYLSHSG